MTCFHDYCRSGSLLLLVAGVTVFLSQIGCSDKIAPPTANDTTSQSGASSYAFLYAARNSPTQEWLYRSSLEDGTINATFGEKVARAPSGNKKSLMMASYNRLDVVDLQTGTVLFGGIGLSDGYDYFEKFSPAISPDGTRLAWSEENYTEEKRRAVLMDANGTHRVTLPVGAAHETPMRFSPDGTYVAFFSYDYDAEKGTLYRVNADGSNLQPLTETTSRPFSDGAAVFDWSPDGSQIVFSQGEDNPALYIINSDGTGLRLLGAGIVPDWSPDGSKILFTLPYPSLSLGMMNTDGSGTEILTPSSLGVNGRWSPDGKHILYADYDTDADVERDPARISVMNVATRSVTVIDSTGAYAGLFWVE